MRYLPAAAVCIAVVMAALAAWQISRSGVADVGPYQASQPTPGEPVRVRVDQGESPRSIAGSLASAGVIDSSTQFEVLVALMGYDRVLQAGDYEFAVNTPALDAVYRIRRGQVSPRSLTVIEGWRLEQVADAVAAQGVSRDAFVAAATAGDYKHDFLSDLNPGDSLEGYLFPAVYPIGSLDKPADMVKRMLNAFDQNVSLDMRQKAAAEGLTLRQVVTLASIIEREAQKPDERPIMAQVFLSRLRLGMPLQADPTVQYAVASPDGIKTYGYWKQDLTQADLAVDSPYNTYAAAGLPPGPICNPGLASIQAVLSPSSTNYLYFVARPDGSHAFAETLDQQLENVKKYQGQ